MKELRLPFLCLSRYITVLLILATWLLSSQKSFCQFKGIATHSIVDKDGTTIPDVQVISKNFPSLQIFSDSEGQFTLSLPSIQDAIEIREKWSTDTLYFQKIGYLTLKLPRSEFIIPCEVKMERLGKILDEVHVVGRSDWSSSRFAQDIELLSETEIQQLQGRSTADILESSGEVFVQRSQLGGGSPIIRGFEANRILLVVDGVRLNNAIYRSGHLHNSISVDQFGLSNIEIHAGPNSLLYGSDALGGVLHFKTKNAAFRNEKFGLNDINLSGLYQSAASNFAGHLDFSFSGEKLSSFSSISFSRIGDLRSGDNRHNDYPDFGKRNIYTDRIDGVDTILRNNDPNIQLGSGYDQIDVIQKFNFKINSKNILRLNLQLSDAPAPRYDQLAFEDGSGQLEFAEWDYNPQRRILTSLTYDILGQSKAFDRAKIIASYQDISEGRTNRKFQNNFRTTNKERLDVWGFSADMVKSGDSYIPWRLYYGLETQINTLNSTVSNININTGENLVTEFTRYPSGDNQTFNAGAYAMLQSDLNTENWNIDLGCRYSYYQVDISYDENDPFTWPREFIDGVTNKGHYPTFSGAITYQPFEPLTIKAISSTAFRAPNIDDIAKIRIKNGQVLTPNLNLDPENAWNNELAFLWRNENWKFKAAGFYNRINNIIVRTNGSLPNGDTIIISNGDEYRVQVNENQDEGLIYGANLDIGYQHQNGLSASISTTKVIGKVLKAEGDQPLAHIPPLYGKVAVGYKIGNWHFEINSLFNGEKPIDEYADAGSDNEEFATLDGTYSWYTLNTRVAYQWKKLNASVRVENILDTHYRTFSSGISASGINLALQLSYTISALE